MQMDEYKVGAVALMGLTVVLVTACLSGVQCSRQDTERTRIKHESFAACARATGKPVECERASGSF